VHSGFGSSRDWDDEFDGVSSGWQFELRSLRYYLERHKGRDRKVASARLSAPVRESEVWRRLLSPGGFTLTSGAMETGSPYALRCATGDTFSGRHTARAARARLRGNSR
jgi:hypothetical protein